MVKLPRKTTILWSQKILYVERQFCSWYEFPSLRFLLIGACPVAYVAAGLCVIRHECEVCVLYVGVAQLVEPLCCGFESRRRPCSFLSLETFCFCVLTIRVVLLLGGVPPSFLGPGAGVNL